MRVIRSIRLCNLIIDRYPLEPRTLALIKHLESGKSVPPIHVRRNEDGAYVILDGRHRFLAHKLLGRTHIKCVVGLPQEHAMKNRHVEMKVYDGCNTQD